MRSSVASCLGKSAAKKRKTLKELHVECNFTEDRAVWRVEPKVDEVETAEKHNERIMSDRHFTEDGRIDEIRVDLALRARARMAEETVNVQNTQLSRR